MIPPLSNILIFTARETLQNPDNDAGLKAVERK